MPEGKGLIGLLRYYGLDTISAKHHQLFAQYWQWSDDYVAAALNAGIIRTAFGWTYRIGVNGPVNARSLSNLTELAGADVLRIASILSPLATVLSC